MCNIQIFLVYDFRANIYQNSEENKNMHADVMTLKEKVMPSNETEIKFRKFWSFFILSAKHEDVEN